MKKNYLWILFVALFFITSCKKDDDIRTFNLPEISLVSPGDSVLNLELKPTFTWTAEDPLGESLTYDLFLGQESGILFKQAEDLTSMTYVLDEFNLSDSTTYYWKVVAKNSTEFTESETWSFMTIDLP